MAIYSNYSSGNYITSLVESKQDHDNLKMLKDQWKKSTDKFVQHKWVYKYVNNSEMKKMREYYRRMCDPEIPYQDYERTFKYICNFFRIPTAEVIIEDMKFDLDEKDKSQDVVGIRYSKGKVKVIIPDGVRLVHISPIDNITSLTPSFRSKTTGKYLYPSKRIFFTVVKEISDFKAGLKIDQKKFRYTPKNQIKEAWIDPTYAEFSSRAVYIETNRPIPVVQYETLMGNIYNKAVDIVTSASKKDMVKEESTDLTIQEAFTDKKSMEMIKNWKLSNEKDRIKKFSSSTISPEDADMLEECISKMKDENVEFGEYKKYFSRLCRFCHTIPTGTIFRKIEFKRGKDRENSSLEVEYADNTKKIELPEGTRLYHTTMVEGITALNPAFRGKTGYFYDKPRVYFTIRKNMPKFLADIPPGTKTHTYECKKDIREVYVDPLVPSNIQGAVYIETNSPVPVEEVGIFKKDAKKEDESKNEGFIFDDLYDFVNEYGLILAK